MADQDQLPIVDLLNAAGLLTDAGHTDIAISLYRDWLSATRSPLAYAVNFNLGVLLANSLHDIEAEAAYRAYRPPGPTERCQSHRRIPARLAG